MAAKKTRKPSARERELMQVHDDLRSELNHRGWRVETARSLTGRGGHCIVAGEQRVILRGQVPVSDRLEVLWEALRTEQPEFETLPETVRTWAAATAVG
ncbi:MAG: hypothetical protein AAF533_18560 [Acidobacteriota bacterium]